MVNMAKTYPAPPGWQLRIFWLPITDGEHTEKTASRLMESVHLWIDVINAKSPRRQGAKQTGSLYQSSV
jgi:hypothetical protein